MRDFRDGVPIIEATEFRFTEDIFEESTVLREFRRFDTGGVVDECLTRSESGTGRMREMISRIFHTPEGANLFRRSSLFSS